MRILTHTKGLDLRDMLISGADDTELEAAIRDAIAHKPKRHEFYQTISDGEARRMNEIEG